MALDDSAVMGILVVLHGADWKCFQKGSYAMPENELAYFRGDFVPMADARVSIKTRALNYGLGCFEGIRAYWSEDNQRLRIF